jgi:hypothetical protein
MTAEDKLRDLLHSEASTIHPVGDGLAKIQQRLVRRRRLRLFLLPGAALATAGATAAFFLLGGTTGTHTLVEQPGQHSPGPTAQSTPAPGPSATPGRVLPGTYTGPAVWPFTSAAQAMAWTSGGSYPWADNSLEVTKHFVSDHLALTGLTAVQTCLSCEVVELRASDGRKAAEVALTHFDTNAGRRVYTVVAVDGGDLTVTRPTSGAAISSPTSVSGRITGVDENVQLRLVTAAGKQIATGAAPAGSAVPWQGSLSWSDTSWSGAAIVGTTRSAKDGSLNRLVVVPVSRSTAGATFVGLSQGHVALLDSATGKALRQLTFPPTGKADTGATWNGSTLLWVRSEQSGCADELDRLDSGTTTTVVPKGTAHLGTPQLSPDGNVFAYLSTPCSGGPASIVVQAGGSPSRQLGTDGAHPMQVADVRDDGTVLVNEIGASDQRTLYVVPATATAVSQGTVLALPPACTTIGGAFDGTTPVTWESCADGARVARYDATGTRVSAGPLLATKAYAEDLTVHQGVVLAWLYDGNQVGRVVRVEGSSLTVLVTNTGCSAAPEPKGCVRAPDW